MGVITDRANSAWYDYCYGDILEKMQAAHSTGDAETANAWMKKFVDKIAAERARTNSLIPRGEVWDFSNERNLDAISEKEDLLLHPIQPSDIPAYSDVRGHWHIVNESPTEKMQEIFLEAIPNEVTDNKCFIAAIKHSPDNQFIGYVSIKDTAAEIWEIAIELSPACCGKGYGPIAINIFLDAIHKLTGKSEFRAFVEPDNYRSQRCMKKAGGKLYGLFNTIFGDPIAAEKFENENTDLITPQIVELADELHLEPKKILSKVLDYRFYF